MEEPFYSAIVSYDAMMMLAEGMKETEDLSPSNVKDQIIRIENFEGLQTSFTINEFGDAIRPTSLLEIVNGEFVNVLD
jgi:ABC-type branched-subunit amino acid transport system substrate-binding protein